MEKSSLVTLILGTIGGILFALGMNMVLVPEWDAFQPGVILGSVGLLTLLITIFVWRKMTGKPAVKVSKRNLGIIFQSLVGSLLLGIGMSLALVWTNFIYGILIGVVGIFVLVLLFPAVKGVK